MLQSRKRRAMPMDFGPGSPGDTPSAARRPRCRGWSRSPTARAAAHRRPGRAGRVRETIRLAFVAALQHLPPKQRAVLILREVLRWKASEVAELLDTTVVSVNSALQRARATLADSDVSADDTATPATEEQQALLERYVEAFERYDIESLVALLHEDTTLSMPPYELWLDSADDLGKWMLGAGAGCHGSRVQTTVANGRPAIAQWKPVGDGTTRRGRSTSSRSQTGGSAASRSSSTRSCSRCSASRPLSPPSTGHTGSTSPNPANASRPSNSFDAVRMRTVPPSRRGQLQAREGVDDGQIRPRHAVGVEDEHHPFHLLRVH